MVKTKRNEKVHRNGRSSSDAIGINHTILNIAILFVAMIAGMFNLGNTPIQANAAETESMIVKSGELDNITWSIDKNGLLTLAPKDGTDGHFKSHFYPSWMNDANRKLIKKCNISGKIHADSCYGLFQDFESLTAIENIENLDTSMATNMINMFYGCRSLTTLDVSHFDTSNVTNMNGMFNGCLSLKTLDVSHFDTSNVTNMATMFGHCFNLKTIDVSHFNTSKVVNMYGMFHFCMNVRILDVSHFDTSRVNNMQDMFNSCCKLKTIDVSKFDTSKVDNMQGMFSMWAATGSALEELHVENFNTSNVTTMQDMFHGCYALKKIDVSKFNTSKVQTMARMFRKCNSLTYLDLSNFDTTAVLKNIQEHIDKGDVQDEYFFIQMFPTLSESKLRTITLGSKCSTLSIIKDNTIYKYGIQYVLPQIDSSDKTQYVIKQKEGKYGPYIYSFKRDSNKNYETGTIVEQGRFPFDSSYDSDFADAWTPEMAGTWNIIRADEEALTKPASSNTNNIPQDFQTQSATQPELVQTGTDIFPLIFSLVISSTVAFMICRRRTK